jgi:two-component system cell cycle sensor histidine kinase/response regulator CckA
VLPAGTTGEALRLAADHEADIQVLLTDVVMPGMNGLELARRVVELRPGVRCLFMSGYTADIIGSRGLIDEGTHYLQKPFSARQLTDALLRVLDGVGDTDPG